MIAKGLPASPGAASGKVVFSADAAETLRHAGFAVSYHVERGAGHTITADGLAFASDFISSVTATD